jgi:hypothetical protein
MLDHRFGNLVADAQRRVERGKRVLEDRADPSPEDPPALRRRETGDVLALEEDGALISAVGPRKSRMAPATLLLPEPDSPTIASEPPGLSVRQISRTAVIRRSPSR